MFSGPDTQVLLVSCRSIKTHGNTLFTLHITWLLKGFAPLLAIQTCSNFKPKVTLGLFNPFVFMPHSSLSLLFLLSSNFLLWVFASLHVPLFT